MCARACVYECVCMYVRVSSGLCVSMRVCVRTRVSVCVRRTCACVFSRVRVLDRGGVNYSLSLLLFFFFVPCIFFTTLREELFRIPLDGCVSVSWRLFLVFAYACACV